MPSLNSSLLLPPSPPLWRGPGSLCDIGDAHVVALLGRMVYSLAYQPGPRGRAEGERQRSVLCRLVDWSGGSVRATLTTLLDGGSNGEQAGISKVDHASGASVDRQ